MVAFLNLFKTLRARHRVQRLEQMRHLLDTVSVSRPSQVGFNVVSLCSVGTDEVKHSSILAWLLDASAGHGLGTRFFLAFLQVCQIPLTHVGDCYRVRREFAGLDSIVDLLVYQRRGFILYIENKIFASECNEQIDREYQDMRRLGEALHVPRERQFAVFLTPEGRPPTSGDASVWRSVSYVNLADALRAVLKELPDGKLRSFVQDWTEIVREWRLNNAIL
jgi:hypothetical protein